MLQVHSSKHHTIYRHSQASLISWHPLAGETARQTDVSTRPSWHSSARIGSGWWYGQAGLAVGPQEVAPPHSQAQHEALPVGVAPLLPACLPSPARHHKKHTQFRTQGQTTQTQQTLLWFGEQIHYWWHSEVMHFKTSNSFITIAETTRITANLHDSLYNNFCYTTRGKQIMYSYIIRTLKF